mmetsp:Transcript_18602/g.42482  ORF Transcript_18602/g.42482 Transcript_18602/m.42482 type:complete len:179 (-) Transcript_18602:367-903(-)
MGGEANLQLPSGGDRADEEEAVHDDVDEDEASKVDVGEQSDDVGGLGGEEKEGEGGGSGAAGGAAGGCYEGVEDGREDETVGGNADEAGVGGVGGQGEGGGGEGKGDEEEASAADREAMAAARKQKLSARLRLLLSSHETRESAAGGEGRKERANPSLWHAPPLAGGGGFSVSRKGEE